MAQDSSHPDPDPTQEQAQAASPADPSDAREEAPLDEEAGEALEERPSRPGRAGEEDIEEVEPADLAKTNILIMFGAFVLAMVSLAFAPSASSGMRREADVNFSFYVFGFLGTIGGLLAIFYLPSVIRARKELSPTWNFLGFVGGLGLIVYLIVIIIGVIVSVS